MCEVKAFTVQLSRVSPYFKRLYRISRFEQKIRTSVLCLKTSLMLPVIELQISILNAGHCRAGYYYSSGFTLGIRTASSLKSVYHFAVQCIFIMGESLNTLFMQTGVLDKPKLGRTKDFVFGVFPR